MYGDDILVFWKSQLSITNEALFSIQIYWYTILPIKEGITLQLIDQANTPIWSVFSQLSRKSFWMNVNYTPIAQNAKLKTKNQN